MLIKYKKMYEKFAMGLLSFMPEERDIKQLQQTMKNYETNENWQLFLWKDEDIIGLVGAEIFTDSIEIHHISVNPAFRQQGVGKSMIQALKEVYSDKELKANEYTGAFLGKCENRG
ncbi:GNAT family N-acetyltransferase [Peribacillus asahii]|uniref:GNAT family N-acetyltransferase n=1 Tax=Peribacillus asahii TaxID=228899 RepID=UPI002079F278|nr:GNAT family N-acetyltransferase [Peribacillus asahii]USK58675.1 GNAT family N-acetyltransferase [Peribacillus asahii]